MNRAMRMQAGLRLPELSVGQAAHAFQQAAGAPEIWLTRARRDAEAETVPSRWLARLTNLMGGLPETGGAQALAGMRARGAEWLAMAAALDRPERPGRPEPRPSPAPPAEARPRRYSVSGVKTCCATPTRSTPRRCCGFASSRPCAPSPTRRCAGRSCTRPSTRSRGRRSRAIAPPTAPA